MTPPRYALPMRIRKAAEAFVVEDAGGVALAYVYFEEDPSRRGLVSRLSGADAKAVGQMIARALTEAAKWTQGVKETKRAADIAVVDARTKKLVIKVED